MDMLLVTRARIILHSPHVNETDLESTSGKECLSAIYAILDYLHAIRNTSFDLSYLDPMCSVRGFLLLSS
jgi:hypothetical protein